MKDKLILSISQDLDKINNKNLIKQIGTLINYIKEAVEEAEEEGKKSNKLRFATSKGEVYILSVYPDNKNIWIDLGNENE